MTTPRYAVLEAARSHALMSFESLWIAYFALGGTAQPNVLRGYLTGGVPQLMDSDVVAQALNERFLDQGGNHPVPYRDELL